MLEYTDFLREEEPTPEFIVQTAINQPDKTTPAQAAIRFVRETPPVGYSYVHVTNLLSAGLQRRYATPLNGHAGSYAAPSPTTARSPGSTDTDEGLGPALGRRAPHALTPRGYRALRRRVVRLGVGGHRRR